ncbi:MAG: hypothetical protein AAGC73_05485 [Verrucomicrobiota bacterium]
MDNLLEIIVPLIIAAIYFFGNIMSGKRDEDAPAKPAKRQRNAPQDPDAEARQREIQEAIRRKIMERRAAASDEAPGAPAAAPPRIPTGRDLRERRRRVMEAREERKRPATPPELPKQAPIPTSPQSEVFSWDDSDNAYNNGIEVQLARIEETKKRAAALRSQSGQSARKEVPASANSDTARRGRYFSGPVRSSLRDPKAARAAIIYSEVLGQPISLRKGESSVPGLS